MFEDALQKSVRFKTNIKSVFIMLSFLYLDLSIINSKVVSKINYKRENTNGIVNCIHLDGDVPIINNISQGSYLLLGIINRPKSRLFL